MLSSPMTTLNNRLQLALLNRKKGQNALEKGFTLVELMIVIVIVGILSAVALPNFLSQTQRAKGTEATSKLSALLKESHAEYQLTGDATTAVSGISTSVTNANSGSIFAYKFATPGAANDTEIRIIAEANGSGATNFDASLNGAVMHGCVNLTSGKTAISTRLLDAATAYDLATTCGGTFTGTNLTSAS